MHKFLLLALALCLSTSLVADELLDRAKGSFKPVPASLAEVEGRPITPEKVDLGKMLFFDARLSKSWLISCNTCHNVATGGVNSDFASLYILVIVHRRTT